MNAYVLLTLLSAQPAPTAEDLTLATLIVKWLTKQQNSHGGFSSTQVGDFLQSPHAVRGLEQEMQEQSKGKGEKKTLLLHILGLWEVGDDISHNKLS